MRAADYPAFLREALAPLFARKLAVPVLLLTVLLTATNIVVLKAMPQPGATELPPLFVAAAVARIGGLLVMLVAIVRLLAASPRSPWRPDAAFWLTLLASVALFALSALVDRAMGGRSDPLSMAASSMVQILIIAPVSPWLVALAVERPLAWSPRPWLRDFARWLPQLVLWAVLLVSPLAVLHSAIDLAILEDPHSRWFWPAMLFDGPLSAVVLLLGFGVNNAAYRRVARS